MARKKYFQELYKYDQTTNKYLIDVSLDDFNDVYDDWDPAPFKKRDIEDEFDDFIVDASQDIPLNLDISIVLYLPSSKKDEKKEATLVAAYRNFYGYRVERLNKGKLNLHKKAATYLILSVVLLSAGYFFFGDNPSLFIKVLNEGVFIGGWVFLWEFFTSIFIRMRDLRLEHKLYKRLHQCEIKFIYR